MTTFIKRRGRRYLFHAMRRVTPVLAVDGPSGRLFLDTSDLVVSRRAFESGEFEEEKIGATVTILEREGFDLKHSTFVDVGANVGVSALPALLRFGFGAVVAVEPSPRNCTLLRATLSVNDLLDSVRVVQAAASNRRGTVSLELSPTNSGDHRVRVSDERGRFAEEGREVLEVASIRLDEVDFGGLPPPGLIWSDTQGYEGHVLSGIGQALKSVPVCVEYWPYGLRRAHSLDLLHETLAAGYERVFDLTTKLWLRADDVDQLATVYVKNRFTDLVALPR